MRPTARHSLLRWRRAFEEARHISDAIARSRGSMTGDLLDAASRAQQGTARR